MTSEKKQVMKLVRVKSSAFEKAGYDEKRKVLVLIFKGGRKVAYPKVPKRVWNAFLKADSKGRYYNLNIKSQYGFAA